MKDAWPPGGWRASPTHQHIARPCWQGRPSTLVTFTLRQHNQGGMARATRVGCLPYLPGPTTRWAGAGAPASSLSPFSAFSAEWRSAGGIWPSGWVNERVGRYAASSAPLLWLLACQAGWGNWDHPPSPSNGRGLSILLRQEHVGMPRSIPRSHPNPQQWRAPAPGTPNTKAGPGPSPLIS